MRGACSNGGPGLRFFSRFWAGRRNLRAASLARGWREGAGWTGLLIPLSWLFGWFARRRRAALSVRRRPWRAPAPVIVVGNISLGGTGKTPLVIWLAEQLRQRGFRPGILSRGYGGRIGRRPQLVPGSEADPALFGDEPPILAGRTGAPVAVCRDRARAARLLLEAHAADILICDDGLQHYALDRDVEIAVVDGRRGFGSGRLLPAGPLREPVSRLEEVDWVILNGASAGLATRGWTAMRMQALAFVHLATGARTPPDEFLPPGTRVHALAGLGNPERFADSLRALGLHPLLRRLGDHHRYSGRELQFDDDWPVICTEKDAVKLRRLDAPLARCWWLEAEAQLDAAAGRRLDEILERRGILPAGGRK